MNREAKMCIRDRIDTVNNVKTGNVTENNIATLAIVDPTYCMTMPDSLTAQSGLDTMCHAVESIVSAPVSYTHLDVYKRQVLRCTDLGGYSGKLHEHIPGKDIFTFMHCVGDRKPSLLRLFQDVYKRQVEYGTFSLPVSS